MTRQAHTARSGFSLLELVITITILTLVGASIGLVLKKTQDSFLSATAALDLEISGRTTIGRIRELLRPAALGTITPRLSAPLSSPSLDFQRDPTGAGAWGAMERMEWRLMPRELDDGLDNDGNGLVDEGRVVWIERFGLPDQREHVLVNQVSRMLRGEVPNGDDDNQNGLEDEPGLSFVFLGDTMRIRLSLQKRDPNGHLLSSLVEAAVHIRN